MKYNANESNYARSLLTDDAGLIKSSQNDRPYAQATFRENR